MFPSDQGPSITLFNFDEPFAENSKYVLTSPRSLKACQIVGIKPVELLSKPLSEFENEYNGRLSYDLILERFHKNEQRRLGLLRLCRDERSKIIEAERAVRRDSIKKKRTGNVGDFLSSGSETEDFDISLPTSTLRNQMARSNNNEFKVVESTSKKDVTRSLSGRDIRTGSPHSPRSPRLVSKLTSGHLDSTHENSTRFDNGFWRSLTESKPYICKESAVQRHGWDENYLKPRSPNLTRSKSPQAQRKSVKMRRTLSVDNIISELPTHVQKRAIKLSENDQKILNAMISKANKEEVDKKLQAARKLEFAEEQKIESELKQMKMKRHQMQLADKMRESQELRELHKRRLTEQREERQRLIESEIRSKNEYWLKEISRQLESKSNELLMKSMQREERKRAQEENLARAAEEREFLRNMTHTGLVDRHENATRTKEMKVQLAKSKRAMKNLEERERHEMKMEETKRRLKEDQLALQYAMESKHRRAAMNNRYAEREKDYALAANKMRDQRKKEQQEETLKKIQSDMESWRNELQRYQSENEERAAETAKKNSYLKGKKAMMDRLQKEHDYLLNKEKIKKDEEARQAELESIVKEKDVKSKMILDEKKYATKASREAAMASRTIRDLIKDKTVKSSFDKMANEAEMMARIENKVFQR